MWVIYCVETGEEFDRVESHDEALGIRSTLNMNDWQERQFTLRWEE